MALVLPVASPDAVSIEEYVEFIEHKVDLLDLDSLASSAHMLRALASNRTLVVQKLNEHVNRWFLGGALSSGQSVLLGRGTDFFVRANFWPSTADLATGRVYQDQFSYNIPHDHNFTFLTVSHSGPGYETDIFEYDHERVVGYIGEHVDIRFLEKVRFSSGMVMLYRANRDIHVQYPPQELTVTLNLMVADREVRIRDQFTFDLNRRMITGHPSELEATKRASFVAMAGQVGDANTHQLLLDLASKHPCRRTRLAAFEALSQRDPAQAGQTWEMALGDRASLVTSIARRRLEALAQQ